jgi:hypothetical protein
MAKKKPAATDFPFGANVQSGKKPKRSRRRQTAAERQMYAIGKRTGQLAAYGGS